jgi:hypothetical protein
MALKFLETFHIKTTLSATSQVVGERRSSAQLKRGGFDNVLPHQDYQIPQTAGWSAGGAGGGGGGGRYDDDDGDDDTYEKIQKTCSKFCSIAILSTTTHIMSPRFCYQKAASNHLRYGMNYLHYRLYVINIVKQ